jgi:NitT/TauT family transport system substrate-binding protein
MIKRLTGPIVAIAILGLVLSACGSDSKGQSKGQSTGQSGTVDKVVVSYVPIINFAPLFVAIDKGYFADQKLAVEPQVLQGGADTIGLLGNGKLDASFSGVSTGTFAAIHGGIGIKLVLPISEHPKSGGGYAGALMIRKALSGEVHSAKDLKGKTVAINAPGGLAEYLLAATLGKYGLALSDMKVTHLSLPNMGVALKNGAIDAALMGDPFATAAEKAGTAVVLAADSEPTPGLQSSLLFYGPDFISKRKDAADRFAVAIAKATRDLAGDGMSKPANLEIISKYTKIPEATIKSMTTTTVFSTNPNIDPAALLDQQKFFIKTRELKIASPVSVDKVVDNQFSAYVLSKLGPYLP